ncbi:TRAP transporter substrate-binding protein [Plastoroseomonas hellenica]|uniref:TRAP transporter substrate-binding protein n=1 Tax=Plastoroseomonas hellenica TaxID=2687306 RepID=A0ABS5F707_9PROT|nr:TRAP transporter substrate-binding protein [Plastoroseomonas hellenica]MBR0646380.1 TRAP transporter substrate-binding protein [Plastoroseomonas hellenica]MBR0668311.1 TRAP transporter substrate-binding protein [Plastoroseomonas hellenica]
MTETTQSMRPAARRGFLKGAAAAATGAAVLATPNVSRAQTVTLRFQSTWPQRDIFHEFAGDFVSRVNAMAGGRLRLELLAAGAVVPAFQLMDAVSAGTLDGGHGVPAYWFGKNKAFSLFGTSPPWFGDANQLLGWYHYGGGEALYRELLADIVRVNVVAFMTGPMPTQPLGWFKNPIERPDQIRGLKYRTVGLAADLFAEMGAAVVSLPGGEIVPALERGVIDGAEFNNPSSDRVLGFPDVAKVYMIQSYHQRTESFEVLFNKGKFDALPEDLRAVIKYASESSSADMSWKLQDRYSRDLLTMAQQQGVSVRATPRPVLDAQLQAWNRVIERLEGDNSSPANGPFFKKVCDSQREWCRRVSSFFLRYEASSVVSFNHFFARG